jgi:arylsulfatase A-like enzyme
MRRSSASLGILLLLVAGILIARQLLRGQADGSASSGGPERPPNLIVYLIDTLRADHLGSYGYARETSPTLDALAAEGVLFENAYSQSSWTRAAVGSLFTGLFPSRHGAVRRDHRLRDDAPTLAEILQRAGYYTAAFISNPNVLPIFGFTRGFDEV